MESDLQAPPDPNPPAEGGGAKEGKEISQGTEITVAADSNLPSRANLDSAISRYGNGESVYAIADELGINHTTLYRQLVKHRETEWRDAKVSRALVELESAEEDLKTAPDGLALTRARERCRAAQWQLERLWRRIYGQEQSAQSVVPIQINIGIARSAQKSPSDNQELSEDS